MNLTHGDVHYLDRFLTEIGELSNGLAKPTRSWVKSGSHFEGWPAPTRSARVHTVVGRLRFLISRPRRARESNMVEALSRNAQELIRQKDVDRVLVGGASWTLIVLRKLYVAPEQKIWLGAQI
jgi:hypothetical protein